MVKEFSEKIIPKRNEMLEIIQRYVQPVQKTEKIPFYEGRGRRLAQSVYSQYTLPNMPSSALDGIAVRFSDFLNGIPDTSNWIKGQAYDDCNTGMPLPEDFDTIIPVENIQRLESGLQIIHAPNEQGEFVHKVGSSMKANTEVLSQNHVISAGDIGLLGSAGILEITVFSKPYIAIIPTGDELVTPFKEVLPLGRNIESNSYMLAAYVKQFGGIPTIYPIATDHPKTIEALLIDAVEKNDAVLIIAGSSLGTKDYTISVLSDLGEVIVPELAHGPGRKSSLSLINEKPILGIAGPPMGAQMTSDLYLEPFIVALCGLPQKTPSLLEVVSLDDFPEYDVDFCERVHIFLQNGTYYMRSIFRYQTTRPQMHRLANGNYYRPAHSQCFKGDVLLVELLIAPELIEECDYVQKLLNEQAIRLK